MASKTDQPTLLRFRGSAEAIEGLAPLPFQQVVSGAVEFDIKLQSSASPVDSPEWEAEAAGQSATWLRFSLPEATPAGAYQGVVRVGEQRFPIVVDVEPFPQLIVSPRQLSLQAEPGAEVIVDLTIVNRGNTAYELTGAHGFGVFDVKGLERGLGAAFQEPGQMGLERVNRLADEVAGGHGGMVRVRLEEGAGPLAPGEFRQLRAVFNLPTRLKADRTYYGTWSLLKLDYSIEVQVIGQPAGKPMNTTTIATRPLLKTAGTKRRMALPRERDDG